MTLRDEGRGERRSVADWGGLTVAAAMAALAAFAQPATANGPAATMPTDDFPVFVGAPYRVGQTLYTPSDTMNYDAVGHALIGGGGTRIDAAHHTLPVPSYVEVTALDTGRTILVRVERRGPMGSNAVIELSPGAAAQLGVSDDAPVRVRRVNPPEAERVLLRAGNPAPERMATPGPLLAVLMHRLQPEGAVGLNASSMASNGQAMAQSPAPPVPPTAPALPPAQMSAKPALPSSPKPTPKKAAPSKTAPQKTVPAPGSAAPQPVAAVDKSARVQKPHPEGKPGKAAETGASIQLGAFAVKAHAEALAGKAGATVSASGKLWLVRKGPYASRSEAEAALAKLKAAGYSEARIQRAD